jgi:hypothetical protein
MISIISRSVIFFPTVNKSTRILKIYSMKIQKYLKNIFKIVEEQVFIAKESKEMIWTLLSLHLKNTY